MIDIGKRSKTLSEAKPVENIDKNLQSFLEISPWNFVLPLMSLKIHENSIFDQVFVERSENDGAVFNMKLALDAKVRNSAFQNI